MAQSKHKFAARGPLKPVCEDDPRSVHSGTENKVSRKRSCEYNAETSKLQKSSNSSTVSDARSSRIHNVPEASQLSKPSPVTKHRKELLMSEYTNEIFRFMDSLEVKHSLTSSYLQSFNSKITADKRAILVDWLTEVSGFYNDEPETLYTAVKLLDVFLSKYPISKSRLQLAGTAVYWIATKIEEYEAIPADECISLMSYGTTSSLLRMERQVLQTLKFETMVAEPFFYLRHALCYVQYGSDQQFVDTCTYCLDSALVDIRTVEETAKNLASAALYATRLIYGLSEWTESLGYVTGHWPKPDKLRPLVVIMFECILRGCDPNGSYRGAFKKYSRSSWSKVSLSHRLGEEHIRNLLRIIQAP